MKRLDMVRISVCLANVLSFLEGFLCGFWISYVVVLEVA